VGKDKILSFGRDMAGKAGLEQRIVDGLTVLKLSKAPAARRGVLF
jgi:hypothetical protein